MFISDFSTMFKVHHQQVMSFLSEGYIEKFSSFMQGNLLLTVLVHKQNKNRLVVKTSTQFTIVEKNTHEIKRLYHAT